MCICTSFLIIFLIENFALGSNWASLNSLCLVKALGDSVVIPNDSEWFGFFKDGSLEDIWGAPLTVSVM